MSNDLPKPLKRTPINMGVFMAIYYDTLDEGLDSSEAYDIAMATAKNLQIIKQEIQNDKV